MYLAVVHVALPVACLPAGRCHSLQRLELFSASQKINNEAILQYAKNEGKN